MPSLDNTPERFHFYNSPENGVESCTPHVGVWDVKTNNVRLGNWKANKLLDISNLIKISPITFLG